MQQVVNTRVQHVVPLLQIVKKTVEVPEVPLLQFTDKVVDIPVVAHETDFPGPDCSEDHIDFHSCNTLMR